MKLIGITGSFASGKTHLTNKLSKLGYKIFSADECVHALYEDKNIQVSIMNIIPSIKIFDKILIAEAIYNHQEVRNKLEAFIHPLVKKELQKFSRKNQQKDLLFAEIPLLFESNFDKYVDFIVTTYCNDIIRLERASSRKNYTINNYRKINQIQISQVEKIRKADFAIDTSFTEEILDKQIKQLLEKLKCQ